MPEPVIHTASMVYVDTLRHHGQTNCPLIFRGRKSCHMYADSLEELHAFAAKIGMKLRWFQKHRIVDHYDLNESRRKRAVFEGAIEQNRDQTIATWRRLKELSLK